MQRKGFTLIELLIVISIIGILASIVLVGLGSFRARGRDARRIADLRSVQNALEIYFTRNNTYPAAGNWASVATALATVGVQTTPNDPLNAAPYVYAYGPNPVGCGAAAAPCLNYALAARLEDITNQVLANDVDGTVYTLACGTAGPTDDTYCVQF